MTRTERRGTWRPRPDGDEAAEEEIRLAIVLNGDVSLAVRMGGVLMEIDRMTRRVLAEELTGLLSRRAELPFIPRESDAGRSPTTGPWLWGLATLERLGVAVLDLPRRAMWLLPSGLLLGRSRRRQAETALGAVTVTLLLLALACYLLALTRGPVQEPAAAPDAH